MTEEKKHYLVVFISTVLTVFLVAYLAFYVALKHHLKNLNNPYYQLNRMEKMLEKQERGFDNYYLKRMDNPFIPTMRPMMINLVKEPKEYKIIVDLNQFNGDEKSINVEIKNNELTIKGEMDKKIRGSERIINFTQTYFLDEKLEEPKMTREMKGEKLIITIPFKTENNDEIFDNED